MSKRTRSDDHSDGRSTAHCKACHRLGMQLTGAAVGVKLAAELGDRTALAVETDHVMDLLTAIEQAAQHHHRRSTT